MKRPLILDRQIAPSPQPYADEVIFSRPEQTSGAFKKPGVMYATILKYGRLYAAPISLRSLAFRRPWKIPKFCGANATTESETAEERLSQHIWKFI